MSDDFLYVTCTTEFLLGSPDYRGIRADPPPYRPDDQGTTVVTTAQMMAVEWVELGS